MKMDLAQNELNIRDGKSNGDPLNFARRLRALGQALERFSFSAFDLEIRSATYLVRGTATSTHNLKFSFPRFVRDLLRGGFAQGSLTGVDSEVDLRFSLEEIERFDLRGRVKRRDAGGMPDPYSISQILRGAGSYLDNRDATKLIGISLKGKWVTVGYETAEGRLEQAQQDLEYFYDYWVKMYLRRSNRVKPAAPSEPTVLVSWQGPQRIPAISRAG